MAYTFGKAQQKWDIAIMQKFQRKMDNSRTRNIAFTLTFDEFREVYQRKYCVYTQVQMTFSQSAKNQRPTDITIDRIDASKGYEPGNVVACCLAANSLKGGFENPTNGLTMKQIFRMMYVIQRMAPDAGKGGKQK